MIIIEGCDLVGKTTMAEKLCKRLNMPYEHLSRLPSDFDTYYDYLTLMESEPIMDRFHWSEWAYSFARQDQPMQTEYEKKLVEAKLAEIGAISVLIRTQWDNIRVRYTSDEMYDIPTTQRAFAWFEMNQNQFDVIIDAKPYPTVQDEDKIIEFYKKIKIEKTYIHSRRVAVQ